MLSKSKYSSSDIPVSFVEEATAAYAYAEKPILAVASKTPENHLSSFEKMKVVRDGISKKDLESLKAKTDMDYTVLAKTLSVTRATLINKKKNEKFGPSLSEKILDIAGLYAYGFEVFENEMAFKKWMSTPNRALNGQPPIDWIDNQFGRDEIRNIIGRINYGVHS